MSIQFIPSRAVLADEAIESLSVYEDFEAEVNITALQAVYISSSGKVSPALATGAPQDKVVGFATQSKLATETVRVRKMGVLSGFSGLTQDVLYYLDTSVAGDITNVLPTGSGESVVKVGLAKSSTELDIVIQILSRRA